MVLYESLLSSDQTFLHHGGYSEENSLNHLNPNELVLNLEQMEAPIKSSPHSIGSKTNLSLIYLLLIIEIRPVYIDPDTVIERLELIGHPLATILKEHFTPSLFLH